MKKTKPTFITTLKRKWFIFVLALIAMVLAVLKIVGLSQPQTNVVPEETEETPPPWASTSISKPITDFGLNVDQTILQVNLNKNLFAQLPPELPVYAKNKKLETEKVNNLKKLLPGATFNPEIGLLSFKGKKILGPNLSDFETIKNEFQQTLITNQIIQETDLPIVNGYAAYGLEWEPVLNQEIWQKKEMIFQQALLSFPLFSLDLSGITLKADFNDKNELTNFYAYLFAFDTEKAQNKPLKKFSWVVWELNNGRGELWKVYSASNEAYPPPPIEEIKKISVNQFLITYLVGQKLETEYQPYFLFDVVIYYQSGANLEGVMILPATY